MNTPRCEFGLCALGGTLFAIGGWIGEDIGDSIESYDPIRKTWQTVDKLQEPRFSMGVVSQLSTLSQLKQLKNFFLSFN
jgi:actin-binding protein IPP